MFWIFSYLLWACLCMYMLTGSRFETLIDSVMQGIFSLGFCIWWREIVFSGTIGKVSVGNIIVCFVCIVQVHCV